MTTVRLSVDLETYGDGGSLMFRTGSELDRVSRDTTLSDKVNPPGGPFAISNGMHKEPKTPRKENKKHKNAKTEKNAKNEKAAKHSKNVKNVKNGKLGTPRDPKFKDATLVTSMQ